MKPLISKCYLSSDEEGLTQNGKNLNRGQNCTRCVGRNKSYRLISFVHKYLYIIEAFHWL
jgi:hypothetical protein